MQKVNQAYIQTQLTTVGQGELLLLLYDGALKFLAQAKEKIIAKDYAAKGVLISKALDIISELDASLNEKAGGDLATNLHQLYFMCSAKLLQANLRMDPALLDISINILSGLRSAYAQIITTPEAKAAGAQIAAKQSPTAITAQRAVPIPSSTTAPGAGAGKGMVNAAYKNASTFGNTAALHHPTTQPKVPSVAQAPSAPGAFAATPSSVAPPPVSKPALAYTAPPVPSPVAPSAQHPIAHPAHNPNSTQQGPANTQPNQALGQPVASKAAQPATGTPPPVAEPLGNAPLDLTLRRSAASARYGKMAQTS